MAEWLNVTFHSFDGAIFSAFNGLATSAGGFFTPFFKFVSFFGEGGIFFLALSVVLLLFKRTRKTGLSILFAVGIGALFTNVIIKNAVARPRPYTVEEYRAFWETAGASTVSEFSFPSGHTTVTTTSVTVIFLTVNKKFSWAGFLFALLMGISRIYLVVHYATDVLAGFVVGGISGTIAYFIVKYLYGLFKNKSQVKFCNFVLNADIINAIKNRKK